MVSPTINHDRAVVTEDPESYSDVCEPTRDSPCMDRPYHPPSAPALCLGYMQKKIRRSFSVTHLPDATETSPNT